MKSIFCILLIIIPIFIVVSANKYGRERTLGFCIKIISPIFIIMFYLSGFSIISYLLDIFHVENQIISQSPSIKVAIDSAIVTLFINTILAVLNAPMKSSISIVNPKGTTEVVVYCEKIAYVNCAVKVNFKHLFLKKLFFKYGGIYLRILNSKHTDLEIDKVDEYEEIIDVQNKSQYIMVNLCEISSCKNVEGVSYFRLGIISKTLINWDETILSEIYIPNLFLRILAKIFFEFDSENVKVIHREEK